MDATLDSHGQAAHDAHGHEVHTRLERRNWAQETISHQTPRTYAIVACSLAVLMLITIAAAQIDFAGMMPKGSEVWGHGLNLVIALAIASVKVWLVVNFFMNARGGTKLIGVWAALGFIWLPLMAGIFMDYSTRHWVPAPGWQYTPSGTQDPVEVEKRIQDVMKNSSGNTQSGNIQSGNIQ